MSTWIKYFATALVALFLLGGCEAGYEEEGFEEEEGIEEPLE